MGGTFCGVTGIGLLVGEKVDLLVGATETDGGCVALFTGIGTFPSDMDIASDKNDFCDVAIDDSGLFVKLWLFLANGGVELDGELVFVIVKLGVIFMLACVLDNVAAKISA